MIRVYDPGAQRAEGIESRFWWSLLLGCDAEKWLAACLNWVSSSPLWALESSEGADPQEQSIVFSYFSLCCHKIQDTGKWGKQARVCEASQFDNTASSHTGEGMPLGEWGHRSHGAHIRETERQMLALCFLSPLIWFRALGHRHSGNHTQGVCLPQ